MTYYERLHIGGLRIFVGFTVGAIIGYLKFGDRQRFHNAWISERLRRRYPECKELHTHNLWRLKGIKPDHEFYRWT